MAGDYRYNAGPISLTASARYDINDLFQDAATWRIGGGYAFGEFDGRVRVSIGTGVKNPSMIELFGFFPGSNFIGNPSLQPEKSLGYSIGYTQEFNDLDLSIDYFRSELENEIIGFNPSPSNAEEDSTRKGVELELRWDATETLSLRGSATHIDSEQDGAREIRRPKILASATVIWNPTETLSLTASIDHNGEQLDDRFFFNPNVGDFGTFESERLTLDAFTLIGLNAAYDIDNHFTLTLRGDNLLDEAYEEVFGYASPGRAVYAGLKANF